MAEMTAVARPVATRPAIERARTAPRAVPRIPLQVLTLIGLSGGCYAVSLAAVAGWQSAADADTASARAPFASGVADVAATNDRLAARLATMADLVAAAAGAGGSIGAGMAAFERQLERLSASVAAVDGATRGLPTRVALPPPVRSVSIGRVSAPAHVTTGGSAVP